MNIAQTHYSPFNTSCGCNAPIQLIGMAGQLGSGWVTAIVAGVQAAQYIIEKTSDDTRKSWGASTYPAKEIGRVMVDVVPFVNNILSNTDETNISENLTEIDQYLQFIFMGAKHLREHHANAKSTKRAHEEVMVYIQNLRARAVDGMIKSFQDKGLQVRTEPISADFTALEEVYAFYGGRKFDTSHKYTVESRLIYVLIPEEEEVPITDMGDEEGGNIFTDEEGNTLYEDENGNLLNLEDEMKTPAPQQAGFGIGGIVILVGLALGAVAFNKQSKAKK